MEEIDLKELFEFFKGKIFLIGAITAVVCVLGCVYGLFIQTPMYQSYTTVILGSSSNTTSGITQSDVSLNNSLVDTYAEIVKSRRVLDQVIEEIDSDLTYGELSNMISVSSVNDTEIIKISVSDEDPVLAKNVANFTAQYFTKEIITLYNMNNVNVLDEAIASENPYNVNFVKQLIIFMLIGLVLGCGLSFAIFYFDRSVKSVEQVEQKLKLPILGSIEAYNGGK